MEGVAARPIDARADGARSRSGAWIAAAGGLGICLSAILFAALYVSSERSIYTWDWSLYWNKFGLLGHMLRTDLVSALAYISWSIGNEDYTVLPLVPLMPFEFLFGAGRLSYILAITTVSLLPSAALTAWIAERTEQRRSWARFLLCVLAVLCLHVLWVPALRGMPDVLGVAIACAILLAWFGKPIEQRSILQLVGIGLLLAVLVLTRRWYLFWAVSFFPAAIVAQVLGTPKDGWNWSFLKALAIAGAACGLCLLVLAAPLIIRIATTD
ncbi:MAG: hypothetical protein HOP96_11905 [Sphingomonas sp.]|nr:hypothetical protein [Sphingomonas sp.]